MKEQLIGTWYVNFAELLLAQMGKTVTIMQGQAGIELPQHLIDLYKERPYLQFAYFLGVYTGVLHQDSNEMAFEENLENLIDSLPGANITLNADNTLTADMPHATYTGAWQLFGTSRLIVTVDSETVKQDKSDYIIPEGWTIEENQITGQLLEGFSAALPLRLPQAHLAELPITWRFEIEENLDYKFILQTLPNEKDEVTRVDAYKVEQEA